MGFSIVKAEDRAQRMVGWFKGICKIITDFAVGSVFFSKFKTIAVELEAQDFAFYQAIKRAIPTAVYQAFSFPLQAATNASTALTFSALSAPANDIVIPSGTVVATTATDATPAQSFTTTASVTLLAGTTSITAPAVCSATGIIGNTPPHTIINLSSPITGIDSVTNVAAVSNGKDRETEAGRRIRFVEYVTTLTRGTEASLVYAAKMAKLVDGTGQVTEQVVDAIVIGPPDGGAGGQCSVFIWNGVATASNDLITEAAKIINGYTVGATKYPGYKAGGVVVTVASVTTTATGVVASVVIMSGYNVDSVLAAIDDRINAYIQSLPVGASLIHSALIEVIMGVDGVQNTTVTVPSNDVIATANEIFIPATNTITAV